MPYTVQLTPAADRQLRRLFQRDAAIAGRIIQAIVDLEADPRPVGCKKLKGTKSTFRVRVGDYRILYDVIDQQLVVTVVGLGHRREVY